MSDVMQDIDTLQKHLESQNKPVRVKALKLMLLHPEATPLQLVQCLCSVDNRNFEFIDEFDLGPAMRQAWPRLRGIDDSGVYEFLKKLYEENYQDHKNWIEHILELINTPLSKEILYRTRFKDCF